MQGYHPMRKWHAILVTLSLAALSACQPATLAAVPFTTQAKQAATPTATRAIHTPIPHTETATLQPTIIASPSPIQPTATPAFVLPDDLEVIHTGNLTELQLLATLPVKEIYELAFSPNGNLVATFSEPWDDRFNDYLEVWDLSSGEQVLRVDKWDSPSQLFFPNETTLYASDRLYDLASGEVIRTLEVVPQAFSPDGKTYATGKLMGIPDESILQLIDVKTGEELLRLTHPGMVMFQDISPDGRYLIGGFQGNHFHIRVWTSPVDKSLRI